MRSIGRLISVLLALTTASAIAAAVVARRMKERIVQRDDPEADEIALAAIFEPLAFRSSARSFRGGTIDCWFGGGVVDLRGATLAPGGATLRVRAVFGGGQIVVPEDWHVETRAMGIGGIGDSRLKVPRRPDAPRLVVEGVVFFGGFGISSVLPEDGEEWVGRTHRLATGDSESTVREADRVGVS